jgi:hypothetical protein
VSIFNQIAQMHPPMQFAVPQLPQAIPAPSPAEASGGILTGGMGGGGGGSQAPGGAPGAPGAAGSGGSGGGIMDMIMKLLASGAMPV